MAPDTARAFREGEISGVAAERERIRKALPEELNPLQVETLPENIRHLKAEYICGYNAALEAVLAVIEPTHPSKEQ